MVTPRKIIRDLAAMPRAAAAAEWIQSREMARERRGFSVLTDGATSPEPVLPAPCLDYFRATPVVRDTVESWKMIARIDTTAQWHQARAALSRGHIPALMGDGEDVASVGEYSPSQIGIALLVPEPDAARAATILNAVRDGLNWCPRCGSTFLETLPLPWWWVIWSILFLGVAPFAPPRFECSRCGNRWE